MISPAPLDEDLPSHGKQKIAAAILSFKMPKVEHFKNENKVKKVIRKEKKISILTKIHLA